MDQVLKCECDVYYNEMAGNQKILVALLQLPLPGTWLPKNHAKGVLGGGGKVSKFFKESISPSYLCICSGALGKVPSGASHLLQVEPATFNCNIHMDLPGKQPLSHLTIGEGIRQCISDISTAQGIMSKNGAPSSPPGGHHFLPQCHVKYQQWAFTQGYQCASTRPP